MENTWWDDLNSELEAVAGRSVSNAVGKLKTQENYAQLLLYTN